MRFFYVFGKKTLIGNKKIPGLEDRGLGEGKMKRLFPSNQFCSGGSDFTEKIGRLFYGTTHREAFASL